MSLFNMENTCLNCNEIILQNFCSQCGQRRNKRIDRQYITDEVQYTILQTNKGFLYSLKKIIVNPGKTAREFIDGKRVKHYTPISMAFVLTGISTFISYKFIGIADIINELYAKQGINQNFTNAYLDFLSNYISLVFLLMIPIFAVFTKIGFRKWGHNYYEHIVMNAYLLSFYNLISILLIYPLMYIFKSDSAAVASISGYSMFLYPFILFYFFKGFYAEKPIFAVITKILLTSLLMVGGVVIFGLLFFLTGVLIAFLGRSGEVIKVLNK